MPRETENPPKVILDYGTNSLDVSPDWNDAAERLIDAGRGPESLKGEFARRDFAVKYYAKSMTRRFAMAQISSKCSHCGSPATEFAAASEWTARLSRPPYQPAWLPEYSATFVLHHAICAVCLQNWRRRVRAFTLEFATLELIVLIMVVIVACLNADGPLIVLIVTVVTAAVLVLLAGLAFQFLHRQWPRYINVRLSPGVKPTGEVRRVRRLEPPLRVIPETI